MRCQWIECWVDGSASGWPGERVAWVPAAVRRWTGLRTQAKLSGQAWHVVAAVDRLHTHERLRQTARVLT